MWHGISSEPNPTKNRIKRPGSDTNDGNVIKMAERERRWFVLKRPRCDISGESETEVTETSKQHAQRKSQYSMMMFITYRYQSAGKFLVSLVLGVESCLHVLSPERFNGQEEQGGGGPAAI